MKLVPDFIKYPHLNPLNYLPYLKYLGNRKELLPSYLLHFVTNNCNIDCHHCLRGNMPIAKNELSIDEIEKVSLTMGPKIGVWLTGGEPFIRKDISEIAKIYYKNTKTRKLMCPSNGTLPDRMLAAIREICTSCPGMHFSVGVAIDGLGDDHDNIRNSPGLFEKATQTYKEVQRLEKEFKNFSSYVNVTFSSLSQDKVIPLYKYLTEELKVSNICNNIVRGDPRTPETKNIDLDKFNEFNQYLNNGLLNNEFRGFSNFPLANLVNAKNILSRNLIYLISRDNVPVFPCYAGSAVGVMFSRGEVYPCELLNMEMGNVRDVDYDFRKLWFSERSKNICSEIKKNKCFCTYENIVTVNLLFNPKMLAKMVGEYIRICKNKRFGNPEKESIESMCRKVKSMNLKAPTQNCMTNSFSNLKTGELDVFK
jgi:MoaA/NifB/PqqE/SkfB family radical SAM enzyme